VTGEESARSDADLSGPAAAWGTGSRHRPRAHAMRLATGTGGASPGRKRGGELVAQPDASLREISVKSDVSTGTVRDVRDRMRRGEHPILPRQRTPLTG
jgi:hypothetical protein